MSSLLIPPNALFRTRATRQRSYSQFRKGPCFNERGNCGPARPKLCQQDYGLGARRRSAVELQPGGRTYVSSLTAHAFRVQGIYLAELTWAEAERALVEFPVVLLPLGARTKEHGLHLPLNNDWLIAEYLARCVAEVCKILVLPTLQYSCYPRRRPRRRARRRRPAPPLGRYFAHATARSIPPDASTAHVPSCATQSQPPAVVVSGA